MALDDDIAALSRVPALALIDREALRLIAFSAETRRLEAGDVLFRVGDPADSGYVVLTGELALIEGRGDGEPVIAGPDSLIGELALILGGKRSATAIARTASMVMRVSRAAFRRSLEEYPDSARRLMARLGERVRGTAAELDRVKRRLAGQAGKA